jgi:hypothetical protein
VIQSPHDEQPGPPVRPQPLCRRGSSGCRIGSCGPERHRSALVLGDGLAATAQAPTPRPANPVPPLPAARRDIHAASAMGGVSAFGSITATVSARAWHPDAPVDERIEALRQHITEIEGRLNEVTRKLTEEAASREQVVVELKRTLEEKTAELRRLGEEKERESARIDARALPAVGFGILLSASQKSSPRFPSGSDGSFRSLVRVSPSLAWSIWGDIGRHVGQTTAPTVNPLSARCARASHHNHQLRAVPAGFGFGSPPRWMTFGLVAELWCDEWYTVTCGRAVRFVFPFRCHRPPPCRSTPLPRARPLEPGL